MPKSTLSGVGLPDSQQAALANLGERIRMARKGRGIAIADLAGRMLVSEKTLRFCEDGVSDRDRGLLEPSFQERHMLDVQQAEPR